MPDDHAAVGVDFDTDQVSVSEIAEEYGLSQPTIRVWVHRGLINATPRGRGWLISRREVAEMLADNPKLGKPRPDHRKRRAEGTTGLPDWPSPLRKRAPGHYSLTEELGLNE